MVKTPNSRKSIKTPKTAPKELTEPGNRSLLPSMKLNFESGSAAAICTPGRTTRSMSKTNMPPPPRPLLRTDTYTVDNPSLTLEGFARPSIDAKKKSTKKRKPVQPMEPMDETSEDDLPSVSMLETKRTLGQFVRARKSTKAEEVESENDLASVSQLGMNTTGQFVGPRSSKKSLVSATTSDSESSPGRYVGVCISETASESEIESSGDDFASVSQLGMKSSGEMRSSMNGSKVQSDSNEEKDSSDNNEASTPGKGGRMSMPSESEPIDKPSSNKKSKKSFTPVGKAGRKSKSSLVGTEAQEIDSTPAQSAAEDEVVVPSIVVESSEPVARGRKSLPKRQSMNKTANEQITEEKMAEEPMNENTEENNGDLSQAPAVVTNAGKKRISVIDLTESPVVPENTPMDQTFSPQKGSKEENNDASDRTFTEENNDEPINDKTFSPVPSTASALKPAMTPKTALTPRPVKVQKAVNTPKAALPHKTMTPKAALTPKPTKSLMKPPTNSIVKKKSPQLKRLQNSPFAKPSGNNRLATPGKMSSAKKSKLIEAAAEVVNGAKANSPKVAELRKFFEFGEHQQPEFRFSLVAPEFRAAHTKPVPNFSNIHSRMFNKAESLVENRERHGKRAQYLLSGKKAHNSKDAKGARSKQIPKMKPIEEQRKPLARVNRARLNEEERQERRMSLFKQARGTAERKNTAVASTVCLKGVRLNRRFELLMKKRNEIK